MQQVVATMLLLTCLHHLKLRGLKLEASKAEQQQWEKAVQQAMTAVRPDTADAVGGDAVWQLPESDAPLRQLVLLRCAALMAPQLPELLMRLSIKNIVPPLGANLMPLLVSYAIKTEQLLYWQAESIVQYKDVTTLSSRVKEGFTDMTVEMFNVEEFEAESAATAAAIAAATAGGASSGPGCAVVPNIEVCTVHQYITSCFCLRLLERVHATVASFQYSFEVLVPQRTSNVSCL
jgi:hypothetical protein